MAALYEHNGESKTIAEWAKALGVQERTLRNRVRLIGPDRALSGEAPINGIPITFRGKTQTIAAWAREIGIDHHTIRTRLDIGWSHERALTEPVQAGRPRPMSHPWKRMTNLARENSIKLQRMPSEF